MLHIIVFNVEQGVLDAVNQTLQIVLRVIKDFIPQ
jgi:hypothetical protein